MTIPIRAYVHRDSDGPLSFVASTGGVKRDGLDIDIEGLDTTAYEQNPVFLWAHDYGGRTLPIGKVTRLTKTRDGDGTLTATVMFDQHDDFAKTVERKYRDGFLNAVSIGWDIRKMEGQRIIESELLDISAVPVPGDAAALMERQQVALRSWASDVLRELVTDDIEDDIADDDDLHEVTADNESLQLFIDTAHEFIEKASAFLAAAGGPEPEEPPIPDSGDVGALLEAFNKETEDE